MKNILNVINELMQKIVILRIMSIREAPYNTFHVTQRNAQFKGLIYVLFEKFISDLNIVDFYNGISLIDKKTSNTFLYYVFV